MIGTIVLLGLSNISDKHERRTRKVLKKKVLIKLRKDTQVKKGADKAEKRHTSKKKC